MKILLLGKNGQLGWELQRALAPLGELIALDRTTNADGLCGDLTDLSALRRSVLKIKPNVIVNAAAYTAVDKAESEPELAQRVNADAPQVLADEAHKLNALLIHYSTDYVFDGSGSTPWTEDDAVAPLNQYGLSKLKGEQAIQASGCQHLIFRTSWVYGSRGNNFAKTMLRLAAERDTLQVINDQIGAPTSAELLADITAHTLRSTLQNPALAGLYHLAASGQTSWFDYASLVIAQAKAMGKELMVKDIHPIATEQYPTPAQRPLNSRLNTNKLSKNFDLVLLDWRQGVMRMLKETIVVD